MRCFILLNKTFALHFFNHIINLFSQCMLNIRDRITNSRQCIRYIVIRCIFFLTIIFNSFNLKSWIGPRAIFIASATTKGLGYICGYSCHILIGGKQLRTIHCFIRVCYECSILYTSESTLFIFVVGNIDFITICFFTNGDVFRFRILFHETTGRYLFFDIFFNFLQLRKIHSVSICAPCCNTRKSPSFAIFVDDINFCAFYFFTNSDKICFRILLNKAIAFYIGNFIINLFCNLILNIRDRRTNTFKSRGYIIISRIFFLTISVN